MRFRISRADYGKSGQPTAGAFDVVETWPDGYPERRWFIEINTIEELMALIEREERDLIVGRDSITIYDDYVE